MRNLSIILIHFLDFAGYYLDVLLALGPFCKLPVNATLRGVTNSKDCPSVDHIKSSALPNLIKFLVVDDGLELKVKQRGLRPLGGGEVTFKCPVRKVLRSLQFGKPGMIKRIRGVAYASKVSPALANRAIESAKGKLLQFIPDIYIYADQNRGKNAGNSPGFGINLVAETTEGVFYAAEHVSNDVSKVNFAQRKMRCKWVTGTNPNWFLQGESVTIPEDLGTIAAYKLLEEVYRGGCVDSTFQWLTVLYMALGQKNISKFITGPLSDYTIHFLQHLYEFFAITFKLDNPKVEDYGGVDEEDSLPGANKVLLTCVGIGYTNMNKRTN